MDSYHKTNKEASAVLCFVVNIRKVVEHSWIREKHLTASCVFPTFFVLYHFLRALQQNRAQSRLLYLLIITTMLLSSSSSLSSSLSLSLSLSLLFHNHTIQLKFLTAGKIVVSGNNKLPRNTKMFLFPVLYISNTFLSILADPSSAEFWIKVIDVSTPISFKLPVNRNGTVPKNWYYFGFHFPHSSQFSGQILILFNLLGLLFFYLLLWSHDPVFNNSGYLPSCEAAG